MILLISLIDRILFSLSSEKLKREIKKRKNNSKNHLSFICLTKYFFNMISEIFDYYQFPRFFDHRLVERKDGGVKRLDEIFIYLCEHNHLELAKWLFNESKRQNKYKSKMSEFADILIDVESDWLFLSMCEKGYLGIVKWLIEETNQSGKIEFADNKVKNFDEMDEDGQIIVNFKRYNNIAFRIACESGHLDVVKWLVEEGERQNKQININLGNDYPFQLTCINGQLDVAKWLVEESERQNKPININGDDNYGFKRACKMNT